MSTILMFDDVTVDLLPAGFDAYAGYTDGIFANISQIRARFPSAQILTIAVRSADLADCLDIESGDAQNSDAPEWFKRALSAGVTKPCLYTEASNVDALVDTMTAAGIPRGSYRIWSAHYGIGSHLCGPTTCKIPKVAVDATQFTQTAEGKSLDESVCLNTFFSLVTPPAPTAEPTLTLGDTGASVTKLQERLNAWHANPQLKTDGDFGADTQGAVRSFQTLERLSVDGVAGPATWTALLRTPPVEAFTAPPNVKAVPGVVNLSWDKPPAVAGKEPTGYNIVLEQAGKVIHQGEVPGMSTMLVGLVRGDVYDITVTAVGGQGNPASAKLTVTA